jgi:hypothetical protein
MPNFLDVCNDFLGVSRRSGVYNKQFFSVNYEVKVAVCYVATGFVYSVDSLDDFHKNNLKSDKEGLELASIKSVTVENFITPVARITHF